MAKTNLLNTRTINFLELLGNGRFYRVPPYQRDYSWSEEQWEDLWNDIQELRDKRDDSHYMGALVVEGKTDREFLIIDGQQRLATLSILALVVIAKLREMADREVDPEGNRERASGLRNRFVGEKDPASLIESSKLFLNETDNAFYQDYLVQLKKPLNPRGLCNSNKLLWDCFQYFSSQINKVPEFDSKGNVLAELLSETIARQLMFILITVDNELNAYTVFETLNARGLELSSTDLLKNYLFSRIKVSGDLEALQRRWRSLIATVQQERFPEFLRYHLQCDKPKVRSQRLFKLVRGEVKTAEGVFALMDNLEKRAELFSAILDVQHGYWIERPECKPFIRELNLFQARQMMPLLFAAWERFDAQDFARILRIVSVISFRYSIVSHLNPNALEIAYHQAAKAVLTNSAASPREVFQVLKSIYVPDDKLEQDFYRLAFKTNSQRKKLAKYILAQLECDASGRACDPETDPASVEHILPENPTSEWEEAFPPESWERAVERLGNLTLLEPAVNRSLGNAPYTAKVTAYGRSIYEITRQIEDIAPEQWTPDLLDLRQQQLAKRAVHLWQVDFS
ncbi:DUF262 domain-containing protein [Gloeobacter violaceus]|uniref:Glr0817 protein n=1 Tax=Gloeobacter violaceus (strain ATCC 29082 / PCC 7421) TaxID=251221 RepID=Q7NME9_GLOVI|nr:DUF262 domain-containing protein [Gloeobacter violaceus]BAC88758.1 glr0817 [Gloeobacter violaceus PCC 7421]